MQSKGRSSYQTKQSQDTYMKVILLKMDFFSLNWFQLNIKLEGKWQYIIFGYSLNKRESKRKTSKHKGDKKAHPDT